jgi:hypothetical protein
MERRVVVFSAESMGLGAAALILLVLVVVLWFVIATAAALKGSDVEQPNRVAQMYGYTVCLIAVIIGITAASSILDASFDRAHPLQSEYPYGASLTSFEAYKATLQRERMMMGPQAPAMPDTVSDNTLRARYDALVTDRTAATVYRTTKTFVTSGTMLVVAVIMFLVHWWWLRRFSTTLRAG